MQPVITTTWIPEQHSCELLIQSRHGSSSLMMVSATEDNSFQNNWTLYMFANPLIYGVAMSPRRSSTWLQRVGNGKKCNELNILHQSVDYQITLMHSRRKMTLVAFITVLSNADVAVNATVMFSLIPIRGFSWDMQESPVSLSSSKIVTWQ